LHERQTAGLYAQLVAEWTAKLQSRKSGKDKGAAFMLVQRWQLVEPRNVSASQATVQ
jgi:hypothetical protein